MGRARTGRAKRRQRSGLARLRADYFAQASVVAGRYGIEFHDVLRHLWEARRTRGRIPLRSVRNVDDLVHVVACRADIGAAWDDLVERHESLLVRRASDRVGEMRAILIVRRVLVELRRAEGQVGLAGYLGDRPLRTWLGQRVLDRLHRRQAAWYTTSDGSPPGGGGHWAPGDPVLGESYPIVLPFPLPGAGESSPPRGAAGGADRARRRLPAG